VVGGRFHRLALVRSGQGVETWRGRDLEAGDEVAIKIAAASAVPLGVQARAAQIVEALQGVDIPCLVPPATSGVRATPS